MPRFKPGDRVQLTNDINRFYKSVVGVIVESGKDPRAALVQYSVRLADGSIGTLFDFQLQEPPVVQASVVFDSSVSKRGMPSRSPSDPRHVVLVGAGVEIHLKVSGLAKRSIAGSVTIGKTPVPAALITVSVSDEPIATKATNQAGEFEIPDVLADDITIEVLVPGKRIVAPLKI